METQVRQDYHRAKPTRIVAEKAAKAAELLKQNGGDMNAAAKAVGGEVKSTDFFTSSGAAEGIGSAAMLADYFDKPVGTVFGPLAAPGLTVVGKVAGHQDADMSKFAQERDKHRRAAQRQKASGSPEPLGGQHSHRSHPARQSEEASGGHRSADRAVSQLSAPSAHDACPAGFPADAHHARPADSSAVHRAFRLAGLCHADRHRFRRNRACWSGSCFRAILCCSPSAWWPAPGN